jgi:hypothetical protein
MLATVERQYQLHYVMGEQTGHAREGALCTDLEESDIGVSRRLVQGNTQQRREMWLLFMLQEQQKGLMTAVLQAVVEQRYKPLTD